MIPTSIPTQAQLPEPELLSVPIWYPCHTLNARSRVVGEPPGSLPHILPLVKRVPLLAPTARSPYFSLRTLWWL